MRGQEYPEQVRIDGWKELVEKLKELNKFGIHCTPRDNLDKIIQAIEIGRPLEGHIFGARDGEENLSEEEYYQKLFASVSASTYYSKAHHSRNNRLICKSDIVLFLGINNNYRLSKGIYSIKCPDYIYLARPNI